MHFYSEEESVVLAQMPTLSYLFYSRYDLVNRRCHVQILRKLLHSPIDHSNVFAAFHLEDDENINLAE